MPHDTQDLINIEKISRHTVVSLKAKEEVASGTQRWT